MEKIYIMGMSSFNMYEETNPPDIEEAVVRSVVESCFPELNDPRLKFHYHGTYNVYLVEDKYLFRFPSTIIPIEEQRRLIRRETLLLKNIRNHLTFEIPSPEFIDANSNTPFMGYQMIQGESLSRHFDSTSPVQKTILGNQVGEFLSQLHAIDGSTLGIGDDGFYDPKESYREIQVVFSKIQELIIPEVSKNEREWIEKLFHEFLDIDENFDFKPVLIHGDFDTSNILVNFETMQVTGIIDFEETRVYDPAIDFIFLSEGVEFLTSILDSYSGMIDPQLGERVIFRNGRQPFFYILWGLEHELTPMVDFGYSFLKETIAQWEYYVRVAKQCFK
ncbi:MAG: phosphotransferase [Candidatus Thorarchaeota archaeon]|nr:phosphotransferase [Candidatus Thorarchaeota archaeon]